MKCKGIRQNKADGVKKPDTIVLASGIPVHCAHAEVAGIAALIPNPRNPNRHPERQIALLAKIIKHQGWRSPVVVSRWSGFVVCGHGRLEAAKLLQAEQVPVDYQDFATEADEWAHLVADNKIAELAEMDQMELAGLVKELDGMIDLDLTGFNFDERKELSLDLVNQKSSHPCGFKGEKIERFKELNQYQKAYPVKEGQVWQLGEHLLLCGDAFDPDAWKRLGGPFDFCFADPPFELHLQTAMLRPATDDHLLLIAPDKVLMEQSAKFFQQFFVFTYDVQPSTACRTNMPLRQHNLIGWWRFTSKRPLRLKGFRDHFHKDGSPHEIEIGHWQSKPLALITPFIQHLTEKGEAVADAFSGSGTTLMAAHELGRKCRSIERDERNCALICWRFEQAAKIKPRLLDTDYTATKEEVAA